MIDVLYYIQGDCDVRARYNTINPKRKINIHQRIEPTNYPVLSWERLSHVTSRYIRIKINFLFRLIFLVYFSLQSL